MNTHHCRSGVGGSLCLRQAEYIDHPSGEIDQGWPPLIHRKEGSFSGRQTLWIYWLRRLPESVWLGKNKETWNSGSIKSGQKIRWIWDQSWKANGDIQQLVMESEGKFLRIVFEDGVDVYNIHPNVYINKERVSLLRLSKDNIHFWMKKLWIPENNKGESSYPGVDEYRIELNHDDMSRIE